MQTMFDAYLAGRVAQDHHKGLLRQAERRVPIRKDRDSARKLKATPTPSLPLQGGGCKHGQGIRHSPAITAQWRLAAFKSLQDREEAERLGHQLGRMIYCCYSELLDRGLPQDRALELTRGLIGQLARNGLG